MSDFFDTVSVMILLTSFVLMANKKLKSYIKTFAIQSLLIAFAAGVLGIEEAITEKRFDVLIICLVILFVKVYYIPKQLNKTYANVENRVEKDFMLNIPILIIACCGLVVLCYFSISTIAVINKVQVVNSISVILIGLFFMISRKKAIGQIIGFLVIENGLFVTALFSTQGMPFIVDLGIFVDVVLAVIIMGIMVFRINEKFDSININELNNLRG